MAERLTAQDVFGFLRPDQVNTISETSERISFAPGEVVYEMGTQAHHFYTVLAGEITLRLPGKSGVSIVIDQLGTGDMFGTCVCLDHPVYSLTAQCSKASEILKIKSAVLKDLMDKDLMMGYALQTRISKVYFERYVETMQKLQAIVMNIPIVTH